MGPGEALAMLGACAVVIAAIAMIFAIYSRQLSFRQRKLELEAQASQAGPGSVELVARLEKRVRVLERLATDRGQDVAVQIEALREERALADSTGVDAR
jgi:hypothetical protein